MRVKAILCVLALAAFAASSAGGEDTYAKGESGPPTHHVNRGRVVDLNLDGGRLAVRYTESFSSVDSEYSFSLGGVAVSGARPTGIGTWHLLTLEESSADAPEHDARIRAMLESAEVEFVSPVFVDHDGEWMTPTPDILVRFKPDSTFDAEELFAFLVPDTTILESNFGRLSGAYRLRSAARDGFDVLEQVNRLARDPAVLWAEPDWQFSGRAGLVPNDPGFPNLWGIVNTGQFGGTPGEDMDADIAWDTTTGSPNVKILILDVGVQQNHPDINQLPGADFTGQGGDGGPVNACDNHGTAVAGIVTAIIDNALGTVGVAPGSVVVSARTFVSDTPGCTGDWTSQVSWTVDALDWGELRGARVSNNSNSYGFGCSPRPSKTSTPPPRPTGWCTTPRPGTAPVTA